jgi:hypothetical protein
MSEEMSQRISKMVAMPLFPFTSDGHLKPLSAAMAAELTREGEHGKPCHACEGNTPALWTNGRWQIRSFLSSANPVLLFLETVEHMDFEHLDEAMAAEFGVLTWRLEAAIRSLESVGRVHVNRWGDGSSHFHVWFQGRPAGQLELYGWGNVLWSQLLDPLAKEVLDANHQQVMAHFSAAMKSGDGSGVGPT